MTRSDATTGDNGTTPNDDATTGDNGTTPNDDAPPSGDAAAHQVTLPQLGESVDSGTIVAWLVEPGDRLEVDDPIAEVSTDKVDTEIPSPLAGEVVRHLVDPGDEVAVGQPILEVVSSEAAPAGQSGGAVPPDGRLSPKVRRLLGEHGLDPAEVRGTGPGARITPDDVQRAAAARDRAPASPSGADPSPRAGSSTARRLSPLVKRLLREHGLEVSTIEGTGAAGRITPDDVRRAAAGTSDDVRRAAAAGPSDDVAPATSAGRPAEVATVAPGRAKHTAKEAAATRSDRPRRHAPAPQPPDEPEWGEDGSRTEPLSRTRRIIAERMLTSLQTTAQLTAAVEADVTRIMYARSRSRTAARDRYGFAPSPLAFIAKATCRALARHPVINASIDTDAGTVTFHRDVNLGIAVDTAAGLMVPVIGGAQDLGVMALQQRINDLARRARDRKLTPDDIGGGTFTITNTGSGGTLFDTPILNPPEAAILATPRIEKRPVVVTDDQGNDSIAIRHRTYLCLSYDHRLIDGADAARFLTDLAGQLDTTDWEQELAELT